MAQSVLTLLFAATLLIPAPGVAQDSAAIEVIVLGTYHFAAVPEEIHQILAPERQAEVRAVADSLADFRPTKIALELVSVDSTKLDSLYRAYRTGRHDLGANERQQLGFRLAARFGHENLCTIDHKTPWPNRKAMAWAGEHRPSFLDYYRSWRQQWRAVHDDLLQMATVREILLHLNGQEHLRGLEELRMRKLELGADSAYPGVAPVLSMYERDLHIFANLTRIAEPGDRVLVMYGAGHVEHLRAFVRKHPRMRLVDPRAYLGAEDGPGAS